MLVVLKRLSGLFCQKELVAIFLMIITADLVSGIFSPTFSLFAASLGASITLIGILSSLVGLTRILSSVPIGILSDARGRKGILMSGMLLFAVSSSLYAVVKNPYLLIPLRIMTGLVITSTFFMGMAYVGDVAKPGDRGLASGVYTTFMGLGFSLGSWLGGELASRFGYTLTFQVAAAIASLGFLIAWWGLAPSVKQDTLQQQSQSTVGKLGLLAKEPNLLAASLGFMLVNLMFDAVVVNLFPLYAASLMISQVAIGSMFATRALASALVRLPTGILTVRFPSKYLMMFAMTLGMVMIFSIYFLRDPSALAILLAGEGICYGMYLTSGQAFITENYSDTDRGTALGVYSMTGGIGSTLGPFILGAVADLWGLQSVFWITSLMVLMGIILFLYTGFLQPAARPLVSPSKPGSL